MGIRESLLNTITSVGNSDFVRIVTAAGASSKATVANLFKSFESGLGAKSSLTTSDYIRVVGSDNEPYKQSMSSMKTAMGIDALNSKISQFYTSSIAMGGSNNVDINFSEANGLFLLLCMDRRSGASPKACIFQKYSGSTNKYALTGGSNWASVPTSTGMRVTLENTYYTVLAIGNVPFTITAAS